MRAAHGLPLVLSIRCMLAALRPIITASSDCANSMNILRFLKKFAWSALLAGMVQGAFGFSMYGQFDFWQVDQLSYQTAYSGFNEGPFGLADAPLGGPMNLGEEYRWNIPVLYYS